MERMSSYCVVRSLQPYPATYNMLESITCFNESVGNAPEATADSSQAEFHRDSQTTLGGDEINFEVLTVFPGTFCYELVGE